MPAISAEQLAMLQKSPDIVRNICVLAHVDHGKTSLTDSLIATNGIISSKMAGQIRYLDSRPDEQLRGITMESSAISLLFSLLRKSQDDVAANRQDFLINLIDSPGHVDFTSEVSTASRLCDGAIILVDAVEGVCSQTVNVLRQTWIDHLKPILVINKMDRLITELKMSPQEAYSHLSKLLESVNAVIGSFFQGERMEDDLNWRETLEARVSAANNSKKDSGGTTTEDNARVIKPSEDSHLSGDDLSYEEKEDEDLYFEPGKGNVIFSSAIDGWAFTVKQFAGFYEKKLGIKRALLEKVLWGDYYLEPKTRRILGTKHLRGRALKPLFVQLVLENLWSVYDAAVGGDRKRGDPEKVQKITKALSLEVPNHVIRSKEPRTLLLALLTAWIPLSTAVLVSVIEHLPSPKEAQATRMPELLDSSLGFSSITPEIRNAMTDLDQSRGSPRVAFVSKMVSVPLKDLPENKTKRGTTLSPEEARELARKKRAEFARAQAAAQGENPDVAELKQSLTISNIDDDVADAGFQANGEEAAEPERLIGFARLFSGTLEVGDEVYTLHPKFNPDDPHAPPEPQKVTITALYLLMGRELEPLISVPAGVVFGIGGLEGHVFKSATLCSQLSGSVNIAGVSTASQPIVRVALEPENPADLDKMILGLKLLQQSDPCAKYETLSSGEHVILTAGELHLERCLKDLRERFAQCEIQAGEPIVPYRETIISTTEMNPPKNADLPRGTVVSVTSSKQVSLRLRVRPLPASVTAYLVQHAAEIREVYAENEAEDESSERSGTDAESSDDEKPPEITNIQRNLQRSSRAREVLEQLRQGLKDTFSRNKGDQHVWRSMEQKIISFGPQRNGPNILVDVTPNAACSKLSVEFLLRNKGMEENAAGVVSDALKSTDFADKIAYAFQLATASGPLCHEPMQGIAIFLEEIKLNLPEADASRDKLGRLTGEVIRTMRDSIRQGFLDWSSRLLMAMYSCEIQASAEVLGRVYAVLTRRRGRILSESMNEGTPFFTISCLLPVAESFGFSEEIRKRTSGAASPQLIFSGFEMVDDLDPFWVPWTEVELEDLGEHGERENVAKRYMDQVRRRKGMFVEGDRLVAGAEKQRTLKR